MTEKSEKNNSNINAKTRKIKERSEDAKDEELKITKISQKLSNKNQDYVFRLEKELQRQGSLSHEEAVAMTDGFA